MNKYFKVYLMGILSLFLLSCNIIDKNYSWYTPREVIKNYDKLSPGDIIILSKKPTLKSVWGHSAVLNENKNIVEFPGFFKGYNEIPIDYWENLNRKIAIFRLKNINDDIKKNLFDEIEKQYGKKYRISLNKDNDEFLYCSQFVYLVYKNSGEKVGYEIDLDSNGGLLVMPFDIMKSKLLENIIID